VLIGGKETVGIIHTSADIIDTTGQLTLTELKAVIANAELVITTDSGPFHIAGAFGKQIIGLFRARRPELAGIFPAARVILGQNETCQKTCKWDHCRTANCKQLFNISVNDILLKISNA
jgi:ADP-heptose:LPS heptosyltransferase